MCTIGSVLLPTRVITFKQCDLPRRTLFLDPDPELRRGPRGLRYLAFEREDLGGPWAGVNERGVAFVAADAHLAVGHDAEHGGRGDERPGDVFAAYRSILAEHESARDALYAMIDFYTDRGAADILLLSDPEGAFLLEFSPVEGVRIAHQRDGSLLATNHFRMLPGAVGPEDDPSTHLRLARAEEILAGAAGMDGVRALLADQAHGQTGRSICRVAEAPGDYHTQASVIFTVGRGRVDCTYLLNGNPRTGWFIDREDVFGCGSF